MFTHDLECTTGANSDSIKSSLPCENWTDGDASSIEREVNLRNTELTVRVALFTSFIIASKAAFSSACFWLCSAIFSLNFRGFAMMAENDRLVMILAMQGVAEPLVQSKCTTMSCDRW